VDVPRWAFVLFLSSTATGIIWAGLLVSMLGIGGVREHTICAGTFHASNGEDRGIQPDTD